MCLFSSKLKRKSTFFHIKGTNLWYNHNRLTAVVAAETSTMWPQMVDVFLSILLRKISFLVFVASSSCIHICIIVGDALIVEKPSEYILMRILHIFAILCVFISYPNHGIQYDVVAFSSISSFLTMDSFKLPPTKRKHGV